MLTLAVGIAAIDLGNNRMVLTQVADQKTYGCTLSTLLQLDPTQIVISARASSSKLALTLGATGYTEILTEIERKYFSVTEGQCMLESSAAVLDGVTLKELENKYLATAAAFAVYKYGAWYAAVVFVPRAFSCSCRCRETKTEYSDHRGTPSQSASSRRSRCRT